MIASKTHQNVSMGGLLVALGIVYGDIGTSPLYVMQAIFRKNIITEEVIFGAISSIFWTLTLITSIKYVLLALNADNKGEGGIFSLFTLVKKNHRWAVLPAILGAAALLADGVITPPISVSSAIEGIHILYDHIPTLPIVISIISLLFLFQRFGTMIVGKAFGPIMTIWFTTLFMLGISQIMQTPHVIQALNPYYAYRLLFFHPQGHLFLGAVFLCTTGAEALYSDLGHCGKDNIRYSWIFVKISLITNYLGQGAWLIRHIGEPLSLNPFYAIIPPSFILPGIALSTMAAVIASQALITGSFTLISEASNLQLWPKVKLKYPSEFKGQLYVPSVNFLLWVGCLGIVLHFKNSAAMEAAYGLSVTVTMLMSTVLFSFFLVKKKVARPIVALFLIVYLALEGSFFISNLSKFEEGGFIAAFIALGLAAVMFIWMQARKIKDRFVKYVPFNDYVNGFKELSADITIPKFATHLVYLTDTPHGHLLDYKIIHSVFYLRPKRADIYWFVNIQVTHEPYTSKYQVEILAEEDVVRITFFLGFRREQRMDYYVKKVVEEMVRKKEVDITSRYSSLKSQRKAGDFYFIILERYVANENDLSYWENLIMLGQSFLKKIVTSKEKWYGLDLSSVSIEKIPILIKSLNEVELKRVKVKPQTEF